MIMKSCFVDSLMMITLTNIVEHTLHQQPHQIHYHQHSNQESPHHNPPKNPISISSMYHHTSENTPNHPANCQISKNQNESHPRPPFQQLVALLHSCKAVNRLKHRHHTGQMPKRCDVNMNAQKQH
ncbi:hypothetical protein ES288_A03G261400v1 [Gossypium darwinii]|uniref:Uncharacterized protein n=1 Tax=Gossypium darwinii TaxID=34276 RepID=A0A5D2H8G0_GOSDA|nr:hypothetical protein ES288_A03G261400v1 [Gossypium darwinii]